MADTQEHLNLPDLLPGGEVEARRKPPPLPVPAEILDGEVIEAPPWRVYDLRVVGRGAVAVARHPAARATARHAGRHAAYVAAGAAVAVRRRSRKRSLLAEMAALEAARGNTDKALEWAKQAHEQDKHHAERRRKTWETVHHLVQPQTLKGIAIVIGVIVVLLVMTGWMRYLVGLYHLVSAALRLLWDVRDAAPVALLAWFYYLGRTAPGAPKWGMAAKPGDEDRGLVVTADGIVVALQNLPIPELKKAFKDGWVPAFRLTPVKDGEGYSAVFSTPMGVTAEMIADKNKVFARNLHRASVESWPTNAERDGVASAGFVNLWVANPGVLDRPAPPWPLLNEGTADLFKGVPVGVTARGNPVLMPVVANNFSIGGLMGQGKSNACRVIMLSAALDPLAELYVHVFAYNGDFDCFEPRLARYVKGAEKDEVDAGMATLHEMYADLSEREQMLSDIGAKKVTRQIALKYPELRPRITLWSECHELFGHKKYGDEATDLATAIERRSRKVAMIQGFDTQDSRKDAIPRKLLGLVSVRSCLAVTGWQANDGFLWDGAFKQGVRATELRPGRDVGKSITTGVSNEQFEILKWHYIFSDDDTGADDARPVIERSMRTLAAGTAVSGSLPGPAIVVRDLLDDLGEVMPGPERVKLADLPARLRKLDKLWGPYRGLDGTQLRKQLDDLDVRTLKVGNVPLLDPADLHAALAGREVGSRA